MSNLAFKITNELLSAGYIIEDLAPTKVQVLITGVLWEDPRLRIAIIHFQDKLRKKPMPSCHQVGNSLGITDDSTKVTCRRCLSQIAMHSERGADD